MCMYMFEFPFKDLQKAIWREVAQEKKEFQTSHLAVQNTIYIIYTHISFKELLHHIKVKCRLQRALTFSIAN